MQSRKSYGGACLAVAFLLSSAAASAQIDMAALAQFKYNQQHALAESLSKSQANAGKGKRKHSKGNVTEAAKPAVIRAHNPTFKSIYSDNHHKNVR